MKTLAWAALAIAAAVLIFRVTSPNGVRLLDFGVEDAAAIAWVRGENIYDHQRLDHLYRAQGPPVWGGPADVRVPSVLPPTTPALMAPFAAFSPAVAGELWLALSIFLLVLAARATAQMAGLTWGDPGSLFLLAAVLALGPVRTGLRSGQPAIPAVCLAILGARYALANQHPRRAGACMALATALKPQVGLVFIGYYVYRRQWRVAATAAGVLAFVTAVAVARLELGGSPWLHSWGQNLQLVFQPGGLNDFTAANPDRDHLANLQAALYPLTHNTALSTTLSWAIGVTLGLAWLTLAPRTIPRPLLLPLPVLRERVGGRVSPHSTDGPTDLLTLATAVAITFLPVYHRYYDLTIVILLLGWVASAWNGPLKLPARTLAVLMLPLLPPVGWQTNLVRKGWLPHWIAATPWWNTIVMPTFSWTLLLICLVTLYAMSRRPRRHDHPVAP